ncbi:MAG: amidohydrolase [Acidimicrobiia bacterium]|nr:amidohydrolase [Acidimicrobiia bacterium]
MPADRPTLLVVDRVAGTDHDAVLVESGKIAAVGSAASFETRGRAVDRYAGTTLIAGLGDAHFHPLGFTAAISRLNVARCASFEELAEKIRRAASGIPPGQVLIGTRLNDDALAEGRLPTRTDLDDMVGDRPVMLYRYCGHVAVANTAALELSGVGPDAADPDGGSLDRDEDGRPNGILRETAISLCGDVLGQRTGDLTRQEVLDGLSGLVGSGLTRLGAIVATGGFFGVRDELDQLIDLAPDLPLHVSVLVYAETAAQIEHAAERLSKAGRRLSFLGMKDFTDGSLGGHTAALRRPYSDWTTELGTSRFDRDRIDPIARRSLALGGSVALHAIGDAACGAVIDYFAELRDDGVEAGRLRIEHASVLTDRDVERLADTGAVASVQPAFLASETQWLGTRLGERVQETYRFKTMLEAGIPLAGGSDCPVEPPFPLAGIAVARDRAGMVPHESLDARQALNLFTDGVSVALREPPPLTIGSRADFTLLDLDPLTASPDALRSARVVATWIEGAPHLPEAFEWDQ